VITRLSIRYSLLLLPLIFLAYPSILKLGDPGRFS
jgi:hypothetical protein